MPPIHRSARRVLESQVCVHDRQCGAVELPEPPCFNTDVTLVQILLHARSRQQCTAAMSGTVD
jgi:hypothetical protein